MTALLLAVSFGLIVLGALLFTNAVEWLGQKLDLGQGAVGSLLAAVGTALPESTIPVVAVLAGAKGEDVAIGAIIGAPFMLATVAMMLVAGSALVFRGRREGGQEIDVDREHVRRDLAFFAPSFATGLVLGQFDSKPLHFAGAAVLLAVYGAYIWRTLRAGSSTEEEEEEPKPLFFDTSKRDPPNGLQTGTQLIVALAMIIVGAELFVEELTKVAEAVGVASLVLALIIAPLATELPEKLNSVIWMRQDKDRLAVGNITGAMAFQGTVPVALGLTITEWQLDRYATA
ncbi:MAG: sodium:calcium antiporter, partial [Thermoleophilaceae bacterium]